MWLRSFLNKVGSAIYVKIGGSNYGTITTITNVGATEKELGDIQETLGEISAKLDNQPFLNSASELTVRDAVDTAVNSEIDNVVTIINNQPRTALALLESMYRRVASTSNGKIRFRIQANIAICHYLLGDQVKAGNYFLEAYNHAPNEPKAISNKTLALIFLNRWEDAYKFAKVEIVKNPNNADLAGYLIQASKFDLSVQNPLDLIPESLWNTPEVALGRIIFIQNRGTIQDWLPLSEESCSKFPEQDEFKYYFALGKIESILATNDNQISAAINSEQIADLYNACDILAGRWYKTNLSEAAISRDEISTVFTLAATYVFLGEYEKVKQLLLEAVDKNVSNDEYFLKIADMAYTADSDLAEKALNKVSDKESTGYLRFKIAEVTQDFQYIADLPKDSFNHFPEREILCCQILQEIFKLKVSNLEFDNEQLNRLIALANDDVRALLIIASAGASYNNQEYAEIAYEKAKNLINAQSNISCRFMLADVAIERGDWNTVILALDGYISIHDKNPHYRDLALAFTNARPISKRALAFFDTLPESLKNSHTTLTCRGILALNMGDLQSSISQLEAAWELQKTNLDTLLYLANSYNVAKESQKLSDIIKEINPYIMKGREINRIELAQLMQRFGREDEALKLAYEVMSRNLDNPKILMRYTGTIVSKPGSEPFPEPAKVGIGCCVKLVNDVNEFFEFLYDSPDEITHIPSESISNVLVQKSLGLSVGENFVNERGMGPTRTWTVQEIKHKYIHAFHKILATFETRFSDEAFFTLKLQDDDITPILETLQKISERDNQVLNLYHEHRAPLAVVGKRLGNYPSFVTAQKLLQAGFDIKTSTGNPEHLTQAIQMLEDNQFEYLVFDTYTIWHLTNLELLPVLASVYKLIVPASVIVEIQIALDKYSTHTGDSLGWENGEAVRYEYTETQIAESIASTEALIETIRQYCSIIYYAWEEEPNEIATKLFILGGESSWDAACISKNEKHLLVSEDMHYRAWSELAVGASKNMWLQPLLVHLKQRNILSDLQYANAIVRFCFWKHTHVFLDDVLLHDIFYLDESELFYKLKAALHFIGVDDDEVMPGHVIVCKSFLTKIWEDCKDLERVKFATDLAVTSLLRYTTRKALFLGILCYEINDRINEYLADWRVENNITDEEMMAANATIHSQISL